MDPITIIVENCEIIENNVKANIKIHEHFKEIKTKILFLYPNKDPNFYCSPIKRLFIDDHFEHILKMDHNQSLSGVGTLTFTITAVWKNQNSFGPVLRFESFEPKPTEDLKVTFVSDSECSDIELN